MLILKMQIGFRALIMGINNFILISETKYE